jgi:hypothetical protein
MLPIPEAVRRAVGARAEFRCEYCRLHQDDDVYAFHVEHILPLKHGGRSDFANLAFACQHCNLHKGSNLSGIDPNTGKVVELFHPRNDRWQDHFTIAATGLFAGVTTHGRATIQVLNMNSPDRVRLRRLLRFRLD